MSLSRHIKRLLFIDLLISKKATGDLQTFAIKNGLSKSQMERTLKEMRNDLGFPIKYDRSRSSYCYSEQTINKLQLSLQQLSNVQVLTREQLKTIMGDDPIQNIPIEDLCYSPTHVFGKC